MLIKVPLMVQYCPNNKLSPKLKTDQLLACVAGSQILVNLSVTGEQLPDGGHSAAVTVIVGIGGAPDKCIQMTLSALNTNIAYLATNVWSSRT